MNSSELLRIIDILHKEKDIEKEILFEAVEGAIASAIKKRHSTEEEIEVRIDRFTGEIEVYEGEYLAEYPDMGRIQAQTAKQVIIQKIREAESDAIYNEYIDKVGNLVNGTVQRIEGGSVIVNLDRAEGILPKHERIRGENYQPGERIKALIFDVQKSGQKVKILLTRASPEFVVKLFELEVPEIGEKIIEIKAIAREPGFRTKVAVSSYDMRVDCIGACVGIRGTRIKSITDELNDERIDIIRWNESSEVLIINGLRPAQIHSMTLDEATGTAVVLVPDDQLSLAIGRKGQNVRLATKLTGWDIKIQSLTTQGLGESKPKDEDPEVAAAREALLQGTSLEAIYSREKKNDAAKSPAVDSPAGDAGETNPVSEETVPEDSSPEDSGADEGSVLEAADGDQSAATEEAGEEVVDASDGDTAEDDDSAEDGASEEVTQLDGEDDGAAEDGEAVSLSRSLSAGPVVDHEPDGEDDPADGEKNE